MFLFFCGKLRRVILVNFGLIKTHLPYSQVAAITAMQLKLSLNTFETNLKHSETIL